MTRGRRGTKHPVRCPGYMNTTTTTTTTTRRTTATVCSIVAAVLLLPGLLTACSTSAPADGVTTAKGSSSAGSSLAACMRGKGYDMEDPSSAGSTQSLSAPEGVDADQWKADLTTCLDSGGAGEAEYKPAKPMPGLEEAQAKATECIRANGFEDYPDDQAGQMAYKPSDEETFTGVITRCNEEAFAGLGTPVDR